MKLLYKFLDVLGLLVFTVAWLVFVALAVGVWFVRAELTRKADDLVNRVNKFTDDVDQKVDVAIRVIDTACQDLAETRSQAKVPSVQVDPVARVAATVTSKKLAGSVERANDVVSAASNAVIVADAALKVFSEYPELSESLGISSDQLAQTRTEVETAADRLAQARAVLGVPDDRATDDQLNQVEAALAQARAFTDRAKDTVSNVRNKVADAKQKGDTWALWAAVGVTVIGVFGALGQMSLMRSCWRRLTCQPETTIDITR